MLKRDFTLILFLYLALLLGLEAMIRSGIISSAILPLPSELMQLFKTEYALLLSASIETGLTSFRAFAISSIFAFILGILLHQSRFLQKSLMPFTVFLQTVPIIALAPLLVIYFGFSSVTTITAALIVSFFPVFMATLVGLSQVKQQQKDLLQFLRASRIQKLISLEIPSSVPTLYSGLRTGAGLSVIGVVSGEFVVGGGLGALIDSARLQQRIDLVFASLILLSVLGLCLMKLVDIFFRLLLKKYLIRS